MSAEGDKTIHRRLKQMRRKQRAQPSHGKNKNTAKKKNPLQGMFVNSRGTEMLLRRIVATVRSSGEP